MACPSVLRAICVLLECQSWKGFSALFYQLVKIIVQKEPSTLQLLWGEDSLKATSTEQKNLPGGDTVGFFLLTRFPAR